MQDTETNVAQHHFPCDNCGGDMRFEPRERQLVCEHCGNRDPMDTGPWRAAAIRELSFEQAVAHQLPSMDMEETRVSKCPNCAAEVAFDPDIHATECPFCATPVVADTGTHRHIKPRGVLPFTLDEASARKAMTHWLGGLWFAPNGLKDYARKGRRMQGIYVPYWTFDADTASSYSGERGTVYYETRTVMRDGKPKRVRVQKIRWRPARGRVTRFFDDVLVLASRSLPKAYTDALEPWDLSGLEPYTPEYLAGFRAEGYAVPLEDGFVEARRIMDNTIARDVRFDIGGDRQRIHQVNTDVRDVTFKHILLPVWLAAYKYRGETYRFVVNGTTGKVQGERPYSAIKIAIAVIIGALVAAAIGYGVALNQ
ncbi:primosomal protein N' (replication factor Y) - superfamily II helicase [Roseobacter sp. YSTF-M11]|uniref:Primosomal protein N' (Replication factor Y) -superfamily II helicase n=1 Tax=Roseobacter insulae TaxID=2859783 RepID=A0A9X1FU80_9RHOB|nr:primosomal protein N' (replication factor Y) - superfamily II helicase [Roseobacter insulae]MBW4707492.1 primosomal protein N' (replication factor Y) - superfamily II helicase [Roseobacter insulae]